MAGIRFIDIVTDAEEITQVRNIRAVVKRLANNVLAQIAGVTVWPFLWTVDWLQTIAPEETGTVSVTNGSATVTGSSTAFTSAMVGRKIRIGTDTAYYLIKSVASATSMTLGTENNLDQPYQGDTDTAATFSIYKDEYLLRADVDKQKRITQADNGIALFSLSATDFDSMYPSRTGTGVPAVDVSIGRAVKTYTTGTVTVTASSTTLTGSSTSWQDVEGLTRGTKINVGGLLYTVKDVVSDTSITIYETPTVAAAGATYISTLDNPVVQFQSIPDSILTMYYRFQRLPAVMDADGDIPDLPYPMHPLIGLGMLPTLWRHSGLMNRVVESEQAFTRELANWINVYHLSVLDRKYRIKPFSIQTPLREAQWPTGTGVPLFR